MKDLNSGKPQAGGLRRGVFVGRWFGIEFFLHYSWFLIATIVTFTLSTDAFPQWLPGQGAGVYFAMGIGAAALFFLSILLHELGHSLVSQRCGIPVPRITLLFIGGIAEIAREPDDARSELKIALGGPAVSVALIGAYAALAGLSNWLGWAPAEAVCWWLAMTNLSLVVFNMIPGYPLDGGRVLRSILWARSGKLRQSTFITTRIGIGFSWMLIALGMWLLLWQRNWNGLVFFVIAIFLKNAAESGYANAIQREVLGGVKVRDIMTPNPICLPASLPLSRAADEFFLTHHHVAYPVCGDDGDFRGLLRLELLKTVPREKWPYTSAGDLVAESGSVALQIGADEQAGRAMRTLLAPAQGRLAVVENGRLVGIVTRHDILHVIEIHTELE